MSAPDAPMNATDAVEAGRHFVTKLLDGATQQAEEIQHLRDELGLEAGMRSAAVDELETLRRKLWDLLGADQLSDEDTLTRLYALGEKARADALVRQSDELHQLRRWLEAVSLGRATKDMHAEMREYLRRIGW